MTGGRRPVFDATLAVVPSDPLAAYDAKGLGERLKNYYNPLAAFPRVYCLSPLEERSGHAHGMEVIPTTADQLPDRLRALGVDIVRAYGGYWACTYLCAAPDVHVPRVVSVHDTNPDLLHDEVRLADAVFTVSRVVRSCVIGRGVDPRRTRMLPNRLDLDLFRPTHGRQPEAFERLRRAGCRHVVLHVGRKAYQKNIETVVRAIARLGELYAAMFIGPGEDATYRALAAEVGAADRCVFSGSVTNADLPAYYSAATCVCMPSRWEGFGIVFIEALACGAVVVASDIAPLNEYMRHDHDALLVDRFEDPAAMANAIARACEDDALRERLQRHAPAAALPFDQEGVAALEVGLYAEILGRHRIEVKP